MSEAKKEKSIWYPGCSQTTNRESKEIDPKFSEEDSIGLE